MSGHINAGDIDRILLGIDALLIVLTRLTETSNMIKAGGEDGISDEDLTFVKEKAEPSYSKFSDLIDKMKSE